MKNLKKSLALLASLAMTVTAFTACEPKTGVDEKTTTASGETTAAATKETAATLPKDTGKTLKIYTWNEEFKDRLRVFYPEYDAEKSGLVLKDDGCSIDSVGEKEYLKNGLEIEWVTTPNQDNAYQNKLDADLSAGDTSDPIDIFLFEADYALKYVNTDYTMNVKDLGITDDELSGMYQYTKDICTDGSGAIKGVSWQATPGLYAYRRDIAKKVLGTDDPAEVQKSVSDWDKFDATAAKMKEAGYFMVSGFDDDYRVFSNNMKNPWVDANNNVVVDDSLWTWVDQTKEYTDKGYNNKSSLWNDAWTKGQGPDGKVFGYFYSTWGINWTLMGNSLADSEGKKEVGNGLYGLWATCVGPASWYWGGTWIAAAPGTDNPNAVADVMRQLTCNKAIMKDITLKTQDYTNSVEGMEEIANSDFQSAFLGGQNHIAMFAQSAAKIDMSNCSAYDQGCNESFQNSFMDYFNGSVSKDEALKNFYTAVKEKYPELVIPE